MAKRPLPTPEELRQLLRYEPETGKLFWRERPVELFKDDKQRKAASRAKAWNTRYAGKEAGNRAADGYIDVRLLGIGLFQAHRICYAIAHGHWPDICDHIDGIRDNNRITNLRSVDSSANSRNCAKNCRNSSGRGGVSWLKASRKWLAFINVNGKRIHLGHHENFEDAVSARAKAEKHHNFSARHGR
tara:strand:+ start:45 stop:605 length:561 start_codon:yes stop_codon:yes gene_type:complete